VTLYEITERNYGKERNSTMIKVVTVFLLCFLNKVTKHAKFSIASLHYIR